LGLRRRCTCAVPHEPQPWRQRFWRWWFASTFQRTWMRLAIQVRGGAAPTEAVLLSAWWRCSPACVLPRCVHRRASLRCSSCASSPHQLVSELKRAGSAQRCSTESVLLHIVTSASCWAIAGYGRRICCDLLLLPSMFSYFDTRSVGPAHIRHCAGQPGADTGHRQPGHPLLGGWLDSWEAKAVSRGNG